VTAFGKGEISLIGTERYEFVTAFEVSSGVWLSKSLLELEGKGLVAKASLFADGT
jgi:hypothetical protein